MNAFAAMVFASLLSRLGHQMARSPVLPAFAADLDTLPEFIDIIVWLPSSGHRGYRSVGREVSGSFNRFELSLTSPIRPCVPQFWQSK